MSNNHKSRVKLPDRMRTKLEDFQRRVWIIKLAEGLLAAAFGLLVSYLVVFGLDRVIDTPAWARAAILITGSLGAAVWLPMMVHKWILGSRQLTQVARLLRYRFPRLSDHLLGIIELVNDTHDNTGRSEALCQAALEQVDEQTKDRDFTGAVPDPKHKRWGLIAGVAGAIVVAAMVIVPAAGGNALWRWAMPWTDTPRYTFAQLNELPSELVVPVGERAGLEASLSDSTRWSPASGTARLRGLQRLEAANDNGSYSFELPPLKENTDLFLSVGDARHDIRIRPESRPELSELLADVRLPDYLQRTEAQTRDVRGGAISLVRGAQVSFQATATRDLERASLNGTTVPVNGPSVSTPMLDVVESEGVELRWTDELGLTARNPLELKIRAVDDQQPALFCRNMSDKRVLMEKDTLTFEFTGEDDFGVQSVGMEWRGVRSDDNPEPSVGEKLVFAGSPEATELDGVATFSPQREGITPQVVRLRLFAVDYFPDREPVYSPTYTLFVLSEEEHAIWLTRQLDTWYKHALETYDNEQGLYAQNRMLRDLPAESLDSENIRNQIEAQAAAERAQARRLNNLVEVGEDILKEAARNDQFNVGTLETAAEMMGQLADIAANRMPSVEDMLQQAASAPTAQGTPPSGEQSGQPSGEQSTGEPSESENSGQSQSQPSESEESQESQSQSQGDGESQPAGPSVENDLSNGQESGGGQGSENEEGENEDEQPQVPSISDRESSMMNNDDQEQEEQEGGGNSSPPTFSLPSTTLSGGPQPEGGECPAGEQMEQAVEAQEELLAQFAEVAEEMQKILTNLEGSTFVKRLKAMSRRQLQLANDINRFTLDDFGDEESDVGEPVRRQFDLLTNRQEEDSRQVGYIMEDLDAFVERTQAGKYKTVLEEMQEALVVKQYGQVTEEMNDNMTGQSIAHAEILADTLDRWAEQLVGPG
ncbi:MAG: hypothetical protein AAF456_20080 [Planctomycetota bacterium]